MEAGALLQIAKMRLEHRIDTLAARFSFEKSQCHFSLSVQATVAYSMLGRYEYTSAGLRIGLTPTVGFD